jgi:polar amino acid transport system substrate-binding protein
MSSTATGGFVKKTIASAVMGVLFMFGAGASAQTRLTAAVGMALSPYVLKDATSGLEIDIVRQALQNENYTLKFDLVPLARVPMALKDKSVDCALTLTEASGLTGVFYSQSHITYQNVAVSLKSKGLKIASIADLTPLRVVCFQNGPQYLGKDFAAMVKAKNGKGYSEIADQESQVKLLFLNRADVVVMDVNIFKYFRQAIKDTDVSAEVTYATIFPPTHMKVAFTSEEVRDKFNEGLAKLKSSGKYASIVKTYIK